MLMRTKFNFPNFTNISYKKFTTKKQNYPYIFNNTSRTVNDEITKIMLEKNKEIQEGTKLIYKNFLFALYEKDYSYLQEVCEKNFAQKLNQSLFNYNEKLYISHKETEDNNIQIKLKNLQLDAYLGVSTNRELNKSNRLEKIDVASIGGSLFTLILTKIRDKMDREFIQYYLNNGKTNENYTIRIAIDVESNLILSKYQLFNKESLELHSIVIEAQSNNPNLFVNLLKGGEEDSGIFNTMLKMVQMKKKWDNYSWIVSDFDNFMNGNPLV